MTQYYDTIIIGAGPAGATYARVAGTSKTLLLDGNLCGKPCGGLLAPQTQRLFARFDDSIPKDILVDPQIFSVRTIDLKAKLERRYQRMYINVDRNKFDRWLISQIPSCVTVEKGICTEIKERLDVFAITYRTPDGHYKIALGKRLIGADGANSIVRRTFFSKLNTRTYIAIQQWFPISRQTPQPFYSCIFDPDTSDSCSWLIYKDEYILFGGAFAPHHCREKFESQKEKLKQFGLSLEQPIKTEACQVLRPSSMRSFCLGNDRIFLIGEAAGMISPSSFEGISYAMNSALQLHAALTSSIENKAKAYARKTLGLRLKLLSKNLKCPFMYQPLLRKAVLRSGLTSVSPLRKEITVRKKRIQTEIMNKNLPFS